MSAAWKNRLRLAGFSFLLLLPWIFFDIDLGDQAYHSLSSWMMAFHPKMPDGELPLWFEQVPVWFSVFIDSLWWRIIGPEASLLFTRVGWLLFQISISLGLYEAFRRLFPDRNVVTPIILALLAVNCAADDFVLSYYVVPPAFGALAFAFLAVAMKPGENKIFAVLSGFFAMLSVQSRLPAALPIAGMFGLVFLVDIILNRNFKSNRVFLIGFMAGIAIGGIFSLACLFWSEQQNYFWPGISAFWHGVAGASNQRYSKGIIFERAIGHYTRIFIGLLLFVPIAGVLGKIRKRSLALAASTLAISFTILLAIMKYGTVLAIVIGGATSLVFFFVHKNWRKLESWQFALLLGSAACVVSYTLGTFLEGIQTFKYGLWLLIPAAILFSPEKIGARFWLSANILVLFVVTRILWPTFPYLERPIYRMTHAFNIRGADGLLTYANKGESLRELVDKLRELGSQPGNEMLVYAGVPSLYPIAGVSLLTRTIPFLHDPGLVEYPGSRWDTHRKKIEKLAAAGDLPRLVVRQKEIMARLPLNPRSLALEVWSFNPASPERKFNWELPESGSLAAELDAVLRRAQYKPVWENAYFVILESPKRN